jgi:DNA-binding protein HU-beta
MLKAEAIEELAARTGTTPHASKRYFNAFIQLVYEVLAKGEAMNISGFGKFSVSHRKARLGVDPRTLKPITIPELKTPKFVAGEAFKRAVKLKKQI